MLKELEKIFRYKVLKMLRGRGKITEEFIRMMDGWRHSGFNVYCGPRIHPSEKKAMENLAAYLIRSSFSRQRMEYLPHEAEVRYQSKDGKEKKTYHALEWLAAMGTHVPDRGQQCVRYYGYLSKLPEADAAKKMNMTRSPPCSSWKFPPSSSEKIGHA